MMRQQQARQVRVAIWQHCALWPFWSVGAARPGHAAQCRKMDTFVSELQRRSFDKRIKLAKESIKVVS